MTGQVGNAATHVFLEGAVVSIPALHRQATTDSAGWFTISDLPPGVYKVGASYIGLDAAEQTVRASAGQQTKLNFNLTSSVYKLNQFTVTGIREGNAEAITSQRVAPSVRYSVALDALGNLPNDSTGELLIRLPGISGSRDSEDNVQTVMVRGTPAGLNTVSVDGNMMASPGGMGRSFYTHAISGALFDRIAVVPAPTPDMDAASIGGAILLTTRDPLSIQGTSEISYRIADRWAPPFFAETPFRRDHAMQPLLSFGTQQVFSVLGGQRNLGISFNAFYSENTNAYSTTNLDNEYTSASPAYNYEYQTVDGYNNRKQTSAQLKVEYRASDHTTVSFNMITNDAFEPYNPIYTATAQTGRKVATLGSNGQPTPTNTGGILPGYTGSVTQVLPVAASTFQLNSTQYSFLTRQRWFQLGAKHDFGNWHIDYNANYNYAHPNLGGGRSNGNWSGGIFTMNVPKGGWTLDQSQSSITPQFMQTAGPSIYNGANYTNGLMVIRRDKRNTDIYSATANASYDLPTAFAASLKTGLLFRSEKWNNVNHDREWNYVGSAPLSSLAAPAILTSDEQRTGQSLPFVSSTYVAQQILNNPSQWSENAYYDLTQQYKGTNDVTENVTAAYLQGQATFGQLDALTGVRMERTEDTGDGYVQAQTLSTAAQQAANPVGSANADYDHPQSIKGSYAKFFPGVYLTYHFTKNLQARADYSNSIGRPTATDLVPSQTADNTAQTLTIANPSLKPQYARNFDADLEYYFEPVGVVSVGWFRKDISDYIVSVNSGTVGLGPDNGYGGDYGGYSILTNGNAGTATIQGWEFNYQQQFSFLPGALKGLGVFANYTLLTTHGNYGKTTVVGTSDVAGFVPKNGNVGLSYSYRGFGANLSVNYTGDYLKTASSSVGRNLYYYPRTMTNLGVSYQISRAVTLSCDISNLFNVPQATYWSVKNHPAMYNFTYSAVTVGVSGKF